jgi:predicted secreted hydrolase
MRRTWTALLLTLAVVGLAAPQGALAAPATPPSIYWRVTGHVHDGDRGFHYVATFAQLTIGRDARTGSSNAWRAAHLYLAACELTADDPQAYAAEQRYARPAAAEARFAETPVDLDVAGWRLSDGTRRDAARLDIRGDRFAIDVTLHGERRFVRAAADRELAPDLRTSGTLVIAGHRHNVRGVSTIERIASADIGAPTGDWTWFNLQLDDGRSLALYQARDAHDAVRSTSGVLVAANGRVTPLHAENVSDPSWGRCAWTSPESHLRYPTVWDLALPSARLILILQATQREQEVVPQIGGPPFWEGAADVIDADTDAHIGWAIVNVRGIQPHAMPCGG